MKRLIIGFPVFTIAFLVGYLIAPKIHNECADATVPMQTTEQSIQTASNPVSISTTSKTDDFVPEFRDLPTFDELFPVEPVVDKSKEKLIEIFDDGLYRQSEVVAKNGEYWLVLAKNDDNFSLQRSIASVKKRRTVSWPGDENDAKLSFNVFGKPIIGLKDIRGLRSGPITTLFHKGMWEEGESEELSNGYRREFVLGQNNYLLRTSRGLTKDGTKVAVLVLELNGVRQVVVQKYHVPTDDRDIIGSLLWVGDLDGDSKLDLYFDDFNEKGSVGTELHLSSYAHDGTLVGLAAGFGTAGC